MCCPTEVPLLVNTVEYYRKAVRSQIGARGNKIPTLIIFHKKELLVGDSYRVPFPANFCLVVGWERPVVAS